MKQLKHVVFVVVALLPILPVIAYIIGNIGNQEGLELLPMGNVDIDQASDGDWYVDVDPNTWGEVLIAPLFGNRGMTGLYGAVAGITEWLNDYAGIRQSVPVLMAVLMLCHVAIVELFGLLIDFLLFVPRKCLELFR